jgi:streptogramin lyase
VETLQPGTELAGFRIEDVAGRGGMGVVYRAFQPALERVVALKVIAPSLAEDEGFRLRFVRESKAAASIDHPNVIPIYSAGDEDGVLYLAMRYVDGDDLRTVIRHEGPLEPRRAAHIVAQVASALDAAHAAGLVHRDVKPANVLLARGDHAYLTDFGLTKQLGGESATRSGHWVGTLGYVAPEQIRGERVDARADVYALGCVLFHALTGHAPFSRENDTATLFAHINDPPPSVRDSVPSLPGAFDAVLGRALAKDPDERYQSAGDLGRAALAAAGAAPEPGYERSVAVGAAAPDGADELPTMTAGTRHVPAVDDPTATAPSQPDRSEHRGPRRGLLAALAVLLLAGVVVAVVLASGGGDDGGGGGGTTSTEAPAKPAGAVVVTTKTARPTGLTVAEGVVWVISSTTPVVTRIGAKSGQKQAPLTGLLDGNSGIASGLDSIWITNQRGQSLFRIDPKTREPVGNPIPLAPGQPFVVDVGGRSVYVGMRPGVGKQEPNVVRALRDGQGKAHDYQVPGGVQDLAVGDSLVWVTNRRKAAVTRIDLLARTGDRTKNIRVGNTPRGLAVGEDGTVWVANSQDGTVTRISENGKTRTTIEVGDRPFDVAVSGDNVWVSNNGDDTLTRIDATTGKVVGLPVKVGDGPKSLASDGDGGVWVADLASQDVRHVRPS